MKRKIKIVESQKLETQTERIRDRRTGRSVDRKTEKAGARKLGKAEARKSGKGRDMQIRTTASRGTNGAAERKIRRGGL